MNIALLQTFYKTGNAQHNAETLLGLVRAAAGRGADLCVAPELAICGPMPKDLLLGKELLEASRKALAWLASELKNSVPLLLGSPMLNPVPSGKPAHNCAVLLKRGEVSIISRKVLLSSSDVHDEHRYFEPGMASGVFDLNGWRIAVVMAEDTANDPSLINHIPSNEGDPVAECLAGGADALVCLGAMPFAAHYIVRQENILASIAARYRIPTVFVNHAGAVDGNVFPGMSSAFDHTGGMMALGDFFAEDILMLDLARERGQAYIPPHDPLPLLWKALVLGVSCYVGDNGSKHIYLGLSGGLDSALVAAIAAEAVGKKNVTGVFMPSPYTSTQSKLDAEALAAKLGINYLTIPIANLMAAYQQALAPVFAGLSEGVAEGVGSVVHNEGMSCEDMPRADVIGADVTEENIQARIRGAILMALANKKNGLVLCTSNKSELAVGYGTMYGDVTGALAVLGDVYKTRVFELAIWYSRHHSSHSIPSSILEKEPSAELRPNQKDSDSLPPYPVLDAILENYIENNLPEAEIQVPGTAQATIAKVIKLLVQSEFKRAQGPPVIRVSVRGFGFGWRMPISK